MQPAEQLVHRLRQRGDLVPGPRNPDPRGLITLRERGDLAPQPLDRGQRGAGQPVGTEPGRGHEHHARDHQLAGDVAERPVKCFERDTRDGHPAGMLGSGSAITRSRSFSSVLVTVSGRSLARLSSAAVSIGAVPASGLAPRTRPAGSMTWTTYSPGAGVPATGPGWPAAGT